MILLDTHAWIYWVANPSELSTEATKRITATSQIAVSAISCWEVAMLVAKGRLQLNRDVSQWVKQSLSLPGVMPAPVTPEIAVAAGSLGQFHGDPADRLIVCTAIALGCPLITADRLIQQSKLVTTYW